MSIFRKNAQDRETVPDDSQRLPEFLADEIDALECEAQTHPSRTDDEVHAAIAAHLDEALDGASDPEPKEEIAEPVEPLVLDPSTIGVTGFTHLVPLADAAEEATRRLVVARLLRPVFREIPDLASVTFVFDLDNGFSMTLGLPAAPDPRSSAVLDSLQQALTAPGVIDAVRFCGRRTWSRDEADRADQLDDIEVGAWQALHEALGDAIAGTATPVQES